MADERPSIRVLVALPGLLNQRWPRAYCVIDWQDLPAWQRKGFVFVAVDPADEIAFMQWRERNPDA